MKAENLEDALRFASMLKALRFFQGVYERSGGPYCTVTLETGAGGARVTLSPSSKPEVLAALAAEEKMILNTLELLGVDPPAED